MRVPKGFKTKIYRDYKELLGAGADEEIVLLLLKTIYGLKQAAFEYWKTLLRALRAMELQRSKADPCVYFKWKNGKLMIWSSWVDDLLSCGPNETVLEGRKALKEHFDIDEVGELAEYVGCKIDYNREERSILITQPVLVQSFEDEFKLPGGNF